MSNPDLPGSYWQGQDEGSYRSGRRARSADAERGDRWADPRDWRGNGGGRGSRSAQSGNGYSARDRRVPGNGPRGEGQTWTGIIAGRARGSHAQRPAQDAGSHDWTGRLSQTADELRNRLGLRGSAGKRGGQSWSAAAGDRGSYDYGAGPGSRTAQRQGDGYWQGGDRTGRFSQARTALRTRQGGGSGWGGGGGRGGWNGRYPGGPGDRFKAWLRSGSWWRHWTVKKVVGLFGACVAGVILLIVAAFFYEYANTSVPTAADLTANWQSSIVYYANGQQIGHFDPNVNGISVDRMQLNQGQIPAVMGQAMAAAEDRHFYTEGGVSLTGLMRAAYQDTFGHGNLQGGSTITMQYAKNYFQGVNTGQNLGTKLKEIIIAMKLGHSRSKAWVMTNYLNLVPFGPPQDTGLGAAAENYFSVNLTNNKSTLTLEQAAMLASLPNSPGFFNPDPKAGAGYTALVARYKSVLLNMQRDGAITASQEQYAAAHFPQLNVPASGNGWTGYTGYLMDMVQQQLLAPTSVGGYGLTKHQIETGGYKIQTTFRPDLQVALTRTINQEINAMRAAGGAFRPYERIGSVLEDPKTGGIWAVYGGPGYGTANCTRTDCFLNMAEAAEPVGSSFKPYVLSEAVNEGMDVFTSQLNGFSPLYIPLLNANDPRNYSQLELMPSLTSPPPGVPKNAQNTHSYLSSGNIWYFTFNEQAENLGKPLAVNAAAAISSDPAFEDLAHRDGIQNVINMAKAFGVGQNAFVEPCLVPGSAAGNRAQTIADCNDLTGRDNGLQPTFGTSEGGAKPASKDTGGSPAIALGENPLTPVEQATTFATLADDGLYHTPHVIASVQRNGSPNPLPSHIQTRQVLSKSAAADVDYALSFDNNFGGQGTADGSVPFRRGGVIGKTGTLGNGDNSSEAWFIGATPMQAAMSVALFTNLQTENLSNMAFMGGLPGTQGGAWPATIWNAFMMKVYGNTPPWPGGIFQAEQTSQGFAKWNLAQGKQRCTIQQMLQGQFQGDSPQCTCPRRAVLCNTQNGTNPGPGHGNNPNQSPSPNPQPSTGCLPFGGPCPTSSPSPAKTAALVYGISPPNAGSDPTLTGLATFLAREAAVRRTTAVT